MHWYRLRTNPERQGTQGDISSLSAEQSGVVQCLSEEICNSEYKEFVSRPGLWQWPHGNCSFPPKHDLIQDLALNLCSNLCTLKFQFHSFRKQHKKPLRRAGRVPPSCMDDRKKIGRLGNGQGEGAKVRDHIIYLSQDLFFHLHTFPSAWCPTVYLCGVVGNGHTSQFPQTSSFPSLVLEILKCSGACTVVLLMQLVLNGPTIFT